ncbi:hypothetical protein JW978_04580 [Candidatus Dojkabacteria bacterium]|nr:hypothetical protein [Candidatus Dojkabacteria bacterium]
MNKKLLALFVLIGIVLTLLLPVSADPIGIEDPAKPGDTLITIDTFNPLGGWGNASFLTIGSRILVFAFSGLFVAWIFIIIFAAIKIMRQPGEEGMTAGSKRIKNVFYGISIGLLFFMAISFIGTFAGVGNIFEWSESFQECSCENAGEEQCYQYKFQAEASREDGDVVEWSCYKEGVPGPALPGMGWATSE